MLIEETDLFADWSPLDFDKWLSEKSKAEGQRGKTSYELMMVTFGGYSVAASKPPLSKAVTAPVSITAKKIIIICLDLTFQ